MRKIDTRPVNFILSLISFYLSSFAIAFLSIEDMPELFDLLLAVIFWIGIAAGIIFTLLFARQRKWDSKYADTKGRYPPGFLRFFSNIPAIISDSILIACITALIITFRLFTLPDRLMWAVIFLTLFSLEMHCVFNGRSYRWLQAKRAEAKKQNASICVPGLKSYE